MVDFVKDKTWAATQLIENNADLGNIGKLVISQKSNIDDVNYAGFEAFGAATVGAPTTGSGIVITGSGLASGRSIQIASEVTGAAFNLYARSEFADTHSDWEEIYHTGNAASLPLTTAFAPADDNVRTLGDASGRWSEIFAANATINTSDAREKTEITPFTLDEIEASKLLAGEIGTYKFLASVSEKGSSARTHIGLTVQRAIEIMTANNLDPMSYGFICFNSWDEEVKPILDENGDQVLDTNDNPTYEVTKEAGDRYGFRYDQLNQFILAGFNARLEAAGV